jgi:hypothetical protein
MAIPVKKPTPTKAPVNKPVAKKPVAKKPVTDNRIDMALNAASFVPGPVGMAASAVGAARNVYQGDYKGAALDVANIVTGGAAKYMKAATTIAKAAGSAKVAAKVASKAKVLTKASNPNIYKTASVVRDARGSYPSSSTYRTPQRDNASMKPVVMRPPVTQRNKK